MKFKANKMKQLCIIFSLCQLNKYIIINRQIHKGNLDFRINKGYVPLKLEIIAHRILNC